MTRRFAFSLPRGSPEITPMLPFDPCTAPVQTLHLPGPLPPMFLLPTGLTLDSPGVVSALPRSHPRVSLPIWQFLLHMSRCCPDFEIWQNRLSRQAHPD